MEAPSWRPCAGSSDLTVGGGGGGGSMLNTLLNGIAVPTLVQNVHTAPLMESSNCKTDKSF